MTGRSTPSLRRKFDYASWSDWPSNVKHREPAALDPLRLEHGEEELAIAQALQFAFNQQWRALRDYWRRPRHPLHWRHRHLVNYDSADVWTHPELFELDKDLLPIRVAGVPARLFLADRPALGNPLYKWDVLQQSGFAWWVDRIRRAQFLYGRHPPRPLPRLRGLLGHPRSGRNRRQRQVG